MSLDGLRVLALESRRAAEIAELVRRHGGEPVSAPAMREVALQENDSALAFARELARGAIDVVVLLTGVGTRELARAVASELPPERLAEALRRIVTVARGPKPRAALRELGLSPTIAVPEPNTWRELLAAMDERLEVRGLRVAVQEYGEPSDELVTALEARGAHVDRVVVYKWALPEDLRPLRAAIDELLAGRLDVALFTTQVQVAHLFDVAGAASGARLREAFSQVVVGSIGPTTTAALRSRGLTVDFEPEHPKMGQLVLAAAAQATAIRAGKRSTN